MPKLPVNFSNPRSVIQLAPTSGVFGSEAYIGDKEGFVARVVGTWYCSAGNTLAVETVAHTDLAGELYSFYLRYASEAKNLTARNRGFILHQLYDTGTIAAAEAALEQALKEEGPASEPQCPPYLALDANGSEYQRAARLIGELPTPESRLEACRLAGVRLAAMLGRPTPVQISFGLPAYRAFELTPAEAGVHPLSNILLLAGADIPLDFVNGQALV